MPGGWSGSRRWARLPADWEKTRRPLVLRRDRWRCRLNLPDVCTIRATEVDHIEPGDDHGLKNLQAVCEPCHRIKSSREGAAARPRLARDPEPHPGLS